VFASAVTLSLARSVVQKRRSLLGRIEVKLTGTYPGFTLEHCLRKFCKSVRRLQAGVPSCVVQLAVYGC
jgi:hypothetical protein